MRNGEGSVQTAVIQYLAMRHDVVFVYTTTTGLVRGAGGRRYTVGYPGLPDIMGMMRDGRILAVEVKQPREKPTDLQYQFMYSVAMNGGVAFWVDRVEQVPRFMAEYYG